MSEGSSNLVYVPLGILLPMGMVKRVKANARMKNQSMDSYIEECIEGYWDEYGYGVDEEEIDHRI